VNNKLKPNSNCLKSGYRLIRAQTYGGGIWHTWFDRDLTLAGIENGGFKPSLIHFKKPILRIPQLAIHLAREINENLSIMPETMLIPILSLEVSDSNSEPKLIAEHLGIDEKDIIDIDLDIVDTQAPGFLASVENDSLNNERNVRMFVAYDNEETNS
ncbi:hypothetical protein MXB_818, partial [Myxobolus squamalis]